MQFFPGLTMRLQNEILAADKKEIIMTKLDLFEIMGEASNNHI